MKKVLYLGLIALLLVSCSSSKNVSKVKYKVISTNQVLINNSNGVIGYEAVIKIKSVYYSATLDKNGSIIIINSQVNGDSK